jgi:hypothetical protein
MTNAELESRLNDIDRQLQKIWTLHGLPSWKLQERQRLDNAKSQGTKLPFNANQAFGEMHRPKPHE